ncbi:MAG: Dabb family protein [Lewinellaceae bacterium]|nr:Dabb family protein [Saprospiraceae bacterium]MCB9337811.1 Dabb family protein [Lewinellaceae bacterium]
MKKQSRRSFLATASYSALLPLAAANSLDTKPKGMKNIFIHHVYFWMKNPGNAADVEKLVEGLRHLSKVKTIKTLHIGKPAGTPREVVDNSYGVSWMVTFKNKADQDSYQVDPIHLKFIEDCSHLWSKVIVYDSIDV